MDGLDKKLEQRLREAERNAPPDYPDWKRGFGCGTAVLLVCVAISGALALIFPPGNYWAAGIGLTLILAAGTGTAAAFRPRK